ncbi:hypothetical protein MAR_010958 [Mya arenaria]|uniref:Uncharacterized protein n=1 Tax=Mya arenaria TaxID=6604 RepID=A0ABY7FSN1_MYAAR|nr:hypothetical protein MAR_010932 [Mya arenaria]WAR25254.1 hypothetical protein MAR_010958 [Mya arenaria]
MHLLCANDFGANDFEASALHICCKLLFSELSYKRKKKGGGAAGKKLNALSKAARKAAVAKKLSKMTKKEKEQYRKGKRNSDSESEFSYRSYVSDGGTRHVARRRRHEDGTYSDEHSYHSSQDEDGEARRRRRRRDREHGADSAHSYYSVVSEGGTRTVRRRRKREDGTYSDSEAFNSDKAGTDSEGGRKGEDDGDYGLDRDDKNSEGESEDSDVSVYSEVSEGGTRHQMQRKRIRDADGNIVGYGEPEPHKPKKKTSNIGDVGEWVGQCVFACSIFIHLLLNTFTLCFTLAPNSREPILKHFNITVLYVENIFQNSLLKKKIFNQLMWPPYV